MPRRSSPGYPEAELLGMTFIDYTHPDDVAADLALTRKLLAGQIDEYRIKKRCLRKDGSILWGRLTMRAVRDARGEILHLLPLLEDVSAERQAREELQKAHDELEMRVRQRTAQLTRANEDLEKFAWIASHDLKEPIRMMGAYVGAIAERCRGKLDAKTDEYIAFAVEGAVRMAALIESLRMCAQVTRQEAPFAPVDTQSVLAGVLKDLGRLIAETRAAITYDPLPTVFGNPAQLGQVFQNLLDNALKYRRDGEPPQVHLAVERQGEEWLFSVRDHGIGFDPKYADKVFEAFQRLRARRDQFPGNGSAFYFTLPIHPASEVGIAGSTSIRSSQPRTESF